MLKAEIYKLFIKQKLFVVMGVCAILSAIFTFSDIIPKSQFEYNLGAISCPAAAFINFDNVNWLLIITVIIFTVKVWINEFTSEMQIYNLTSKNGRLRLAVIKLFFVIICTIFCTFLYDLLRYFSLGMQLGFENSDSIALTSCGVNFEAATRDISAFDGALITALLHITGYVFFAVQCSFLALLLKNTVNFTVCSFLLVALPSYIVPDLSDRLRLPLATSLMQGGSMLRGDIRYSDNPSKFMFKELGNNEIIVSVVIQTNIVLLLLVGTLCLFLGKRPHISKKMKFVFMAAVITLISGCNSEHITDYSDNYLFVQNDLIYSKKDNKLFSVNTTPFSDKNIVEVVGDTALVWESCDNTTATFQIKAVSLCDFSEKTLLTIGKATNKNGLLGLDEIIEIPHKLTFDENYMLSRNFIFDENKLYFQNKGLIVVYDLLSQNRIEITIDDEISNLMVSCGDIYYIGNDGLLYKNQTRITDKTVIDYILNNGNLAYITANGDIVIENQSYICNDFAGFLYYDENTIVYHTSTGTAVNYYGKIYSYDEFAFAADKDGVYMFDGERVDVKGYQYA